MCDMCDMCRSDPDADVIASLVPGQEIELTPRDSGGSRPTKKIIWMVDGYSAICTDGTRLNGFDGSIVKPLNEIHPVVKPSLYARLVVALTTSDFLLGLQYDIEMTMLNIGSKFRLWNYMRKKKAAKK